jgi:D-amino-acid oxidase
VRNRAAIIGAGVSGLTCGIVFAEREWNVTIFANETGQETTSAAAGAVWFPYHAEPIDKVIPWSLTTYGRLRELARDSRTGVSMLELHHFTRTDEIPIPDWAKSLGRAPNLRHPERKSRSGSTEGLRGATKKLPFSAGYALTVPLIDTTIYLDYLANRFRNAGGIIESAHIIIRWTKFRPILI